MDTHTPVLRKDFRELFVQILSPEAGFYRVILVYSIAISLLTLAVPVSVQLLVDTVTNIAIPTSVILIAVLLFILLFISGILYAFRAYAMELFTRRIYARLGSEITFTALQAERAFFEEEHRTDLLNRYFDIMSLKRNVPYVLSNGFTLIMQSVIGFILVSLYHLYFFVFCLALVALLWLIWLMWGWPATQTAFELSEAKHRTGAWLQTLAINNGVFKTPKHNSWALEKSDRLINDHIDCQARHFRYTFRQLLSMLFLYAAASAILLGIGGLLVIRGELTLGQLVAAELIMSAIFVGLPQMAGYLEYYFDICAAVEELGRFRDVRTELPESGNCMDLPETPDLHFRHTQITNHASEVTLDLKFPGSGITLINSTPEIQRLFCDLIKRYRQPRAGSIIVGDRELADFDITRLREQIMIIDRPTLLPMTIREYLGLYRQSDQATSLHSALACVGLDETVATLPGGYDTRLSHRGWPLTLEQAIKLKMAAALLSASPIIVLGNLCDAVEDSTLTSWAETLQSAGRVVFLFTSRKTLKVVGHRAVLTRDVQTIEPLARKENEDEV